jgi:glycosyltransferase involved in cell wall biosynthesis
MHTTIDIMLPYYGDVALMQTAVRSVLAQTDQDWRLTVVDDGREAGVPEWFATLGDARVRYQRNPENLGVTANYRKCIGLAEHEYMVMMGTDDVMLPNYLATIRSVLAEHSGVDMIQPGVEVIDGRGVVVNTLADQAKRRLYAPKVRSRARLGGEELATSLLRGDWLYFPSICWKTSTLKATPLRDGLDVIQDLALIIDILQAGGELVVDTTTCFQYRRHTVSASAVGLINGSRFAEARGYFIDAAEQMRAHGWPRAARVARRYTASRLHALTLLPAAIRARHGAGVRNLTRHAFGPSRKTA